MKFRAVGAWLGFIFLACFNSAYACSHIASSIILEDLTRPKYQAYCRPLPVNITPAPYELFENPGQTQSFLNISRLKTSSLFVNDVFMNGRERSLSPLPALKRDDAYQEAGRLRKLLRHSVPHAAFYSGDRNQKWIRLAHQEVERAGISIKRAQILVVVDRNPKVQFLYLILALPKGQGEWMGIGGEHVSTGNKGRKLYYITPTGVFTNTTERIGYRALGTKNKLGIRGNGGKGMRVWDFGWQWAEKGWLPNHVKGQIRLEMHATDPVYLEPRLGHPASEGCVRISAAMNRFIDRFGIIDALYSQAADHDKRFRAILLKDRQPTPIAGDLLVIVDSSKKKSF